MNHESQEGRARLRESFVRTLTLMEAMGVPRNVLIDVIDAVLVEVRAEKASASPPSRRAEIKEKDADDPDMRVARRNSEAGAKLLSPVLQTIASKHGMETAISACVSQLAYMLTEVKKTGAGGRAIVKATLDALLQVVETGEDTYVSITMKKQH